jgi:undecaprenyl diphosphate synthase
MKPLPQHVAIIMDGNGRWASHRHLPRIAGHRAGAKTAREIIELSAKKGIEVLTLFAFGLDNHSRPASEVNELMRLFLESLEKHTEELHKNRVQFRIIGDRQYFDSALLERIERSEAMTRDNTGLKVVIAANYSGRWDIVQATRAVSQRVASGELKPSDVTESSLQEHLSLSDLPEPDLFIRTSGEQRISNFMLWQFCYTELYFTTACWPDFNREEYEKALASFQLRERRFGKTSEQLKAGL